MKRKLTVKQQSIRDFRKFLVDNDALEAWTKNAKRAAKERGCTISHIFTIKRVDDYIISAFPWYKTREEGDYWAHLSIKWRDEVEKSK